MSQVEIPQVTLPVVESITPTYVATAGITTTVVETSVAVVNEVAKAPALTRKEKLTARATALHGIITKNTAEYNALIETLKAIDTIANVKVGDKAVGNFGRAETARVVEGVVVGVFHSDAGISIKVIVGSGFDTDVLVLNESNITAIIPA